MTQVLYHISVFQFIAVFAEVLTRADSGDGRDFFKREFFSGDIFRRFQKFSTKAFVLGSAFGLADRRKYAHAFNFPDNRGIPKNF